MKVRIKSMEELNLPSCKQLQFCSLTWICILSLEGASVCSESCTGRAPLRLPGGSGGSHSVPLCAFATPTPSAVTTPWHSVVMSFKHWKFPGNVQTCKLEPEYIHFYQMWSSTPALRNKETKGWSTRVCVCLHLENTISPLLAHVLLLQSMWKTWKASVC